MKTLHDAAGIRSVAWRSASFGQAIFDLARVSGLVPRVAAVPTVPSDVLADEVRVDRWFEATAEYFGVEAEATDVPYPDVETLLRSCAPALVRLDNADKTVAALVVVRSSRLTLTVLSPSGVRREVSVGALAELVREQRAPEVGRTLSTWLAELALDPKHSARAATALSREVGGLRPISGFWILRPRPGASVLQQLRHSGDIGRFLLFVVVQVVQVLLGLLGWNALLDGSLVGRVEFSSLQRWVLLTVSITTLELLRSFLLARLNVSIAALLKRRMLVGALRLDPQEIRTRGSGGVLALITESEALETAGITSILALVSASISMFSAGGVLWNGLGGGKHVLLLFGWSVIIVVSSVVLGNRSRRWVDLRVAMTNSLVERMIGHRTRMAQESAVGRHRAEDDELVIYLATSRNMDQMATVLRAVPARGWLVAGFLTLIPMMSEAGNQDPRLVLLALGGLTLAQGAFGQISTAVNGLLAVIIAWRKSGALFRAADSKEPYGLPNAATHEFETTDAARTALEARNVTFRYTKGGEPVLRRCSLALQTGDKVLLQGSSGRGKSTLVSVLAGLQSPEAGMVLHYGLDRNTLGALAWRRRIASVPQFHENHILSGSLLFNLVMGRRWPATSEDRKAAEEVCRSLGLGPVIDRMPAGLEQVVGETGWQLSHGERSRVFLARALLQDAEVVLVDESFGALDPETMAQAVDVTLRSTDTLLVIAHP